LIFSLEVLSQLTRRLFSPAPFADGEAGMKKLVHQETSMLS
jgi:hypothetical protein